MTDNNHPITPTPEQVRQWLGEFFGCVVTGQLSDPEKFLATQAARWGANQELEACCKWAAEQDRGFDHELRAARRPQPKSLAEEALEELQLMEGAMYSADLGCDFSATRRALERLQELEKQE